MESSEDKTKRKFAAYLRKPIWTIQYSVFYVDRPGSNQLLVDQKVFRRELKRKFPNQPFLVRVQTLQRGAVLQAYLTLFTTQEADGIKELAERYFPAEIRVPSKKLTVEQCELKAHKILTQKPHDLTKMFGQVRVRRYGVINKQLLEGIGTEV
jgi:hypothetical protein